MDWADKNFRIVYHFIPSTMAGRLEGSSSSGLVHSSLHSSVQSLLRSCLPIVAGRKAGGRWRGFITSVANRNLRAMSFYRKEEARNVRAFCSISRSSLLSSSAASRCFFRLSVLFLFNRESRVPSFLLLVLRPSSIAFSISSNGRRGCSSPIIPADANRAELFADNFAERKSHRVRLLSKLNAARFYRFPRRSIARRRDRTCRFFLCTIVRV